MVDHYKKEVLGILNGFKVTSINIHCKWKFPLLRFPVVFFDLV